MLYSCSNSHFLWPSPSFLCLSSFSRLASRTKAVFVGQYPSSSMTSSIFSMRGVGSETDEKPLLPFFRVRLRRCVELLDGVFSLLSRLTTYDFRHWTYAVRQGMLDGAKPKLVAFKVEPCFKSRCPLENSTCSVLDLHF
jgi:hypothetical protein